MLLRSLLLFLMLNTSAFAADRDAYEDDDSASNASMLVLNTSNPQQHTLHIPEDEDWVMFPIKQNEWYELRVTSVGKSADVVMDIYAADGQTLLLSVDEKFASEEEKLVAQSPLSGFLYLSIRLAIPVFNGEQTEYTVLVNRLIDPDTVAAREVGRIRGKVTDNKGLGIEWAYISTSRGNALSMKQGQKYTLEEDGNILEAEIGDYAMPIYQLGVMDIKAEACGYQTYLKSDYTVTNKDHVLDISLTPAHPDNLIPSKNTYFNGERIQVPLPPLPPQCKQHVGIGYPDNGGIYLVSGKTISTSQLKLFPQDSFPALSDMSQNLLDFAVTEDMPRGEYTLYLVRVPQNIYYNHRTDDGLLQYMSYWKYGVSTFTIQ